MNGFLMRDERMLPAVISFSAINGVALLYAFLGPPYVEALSLHLSRFEYQCFLKSIHVVVFFLWTLAWMKLCNSHESRFDLPLLVIILIPPVIAVISEILQYKIPGHRVQISGALASLLGVVLAYGWLFLRNSPQRAGRRGAV